MINFPPRMILYYLLLNLLVLSLLVLKLLKFFIYEYIDKT